VSAAARAAGWVWRGTGPLPALARAALLPWSALYQAGAAARNLAYDAGWRRTHPLPLPAVGLGNLTVGGTGKTPFAMHVCRLLAERKVRPGVVLRGYGGDEARELAEALPDVVVKAGADRVAAAEAARSAGAQVLVLDDCLQHRRVRPDVMLALVAAETWHGNQWPLPAGPWREGPAALERADAVVVTARTAGITEAAALAEALSRRTRGGTAIVARVAPVAFRPLAGGEARGPDLIAGRAVLAAVGIGEPSLFAAQLEHLGARVEWIDYGDHHAYRAADALQAANWAGPDGLVVTTAKDAVKLRALWPADGPPCWVAEARVTIEAGADGLAALLDRVATAARANHPGAAAAPPARAI